jgi:ribonuclease HI
MPSLRKYKSDQVITINSDASFSHKLQKGGWACWVSYNGGRIQKAGTFKSPVRNSTDAEIKAVCNAFYYVEKILKDKDIKMVIVNCDNQSVRTVITKREIINSCTESSKALIDYVHKYECVIAKFIKGHQSAYNSRQYVNNWCDVNSRNYLK